MEDAEIAKDLSITLKKWKKKPGNLIMILHEIQDRHGYVPRQMAHAVARELNIPLAQIYEVLTFYNLFKVSPPGDFVISSCLGTACYLKGGQAVMDAFSERLGIKEGETTPDGHFHLQRVRCLGCCGIAPVAIINGKIIQARTFNAGNVIADCLQELKAKEPDL